MSRLSGWCSQRGIPNCRGCRDLECSHDCGHPGRAVAVVSVPNTGSIDGKIGSTSKDGPEGLTVGAGDVFLRASPDAVRSAEL